MHYFPRSVLRYVTHARVILDLLGRRSSCPWCVISGQRLYAWPLTIVNCLLFAVFGGSNPHFAPLRHMAPPSLPSCEAPNRLRAVFMIVLPCTVSFLSSLIVHDPSSTYLKSALPLALPIFFSLKFPEFSYSIVSSSFFVLLLA